jgi:hypothetical protein
MAAGESAGHGGRWGCNMPATCSRSLADVRGLGQARRMLDPVGVASIWQRYGTETVINGETDVRPLLTGLYGAGEAGRMANLVFPHPVLSLR